ncbi:MAG TPA: vWA domain-containing protein [Polyangiales bacterium]
MYSWKHYGSCAAALWLLAGCSDDKNGQNLLPRVSGEPDATTEPSIDGGGDARVDARVTSHSDATTPDEDAGCNHAELNFDPRTPTTYLLVDRSSSMFDGATPRWAPLKQGVLSVVQQLSSSVRFGFASYTGKNGGTCPDMTEVAIAQGNYAAIAAAYDALGAPAYKGETPTSKAIAQAAAVLAADPDTGPKSILLVTDGEPDFCDDGEVTCARDAVVAAVQAAYAQGIKTFMFSIGGGVASAHLRDVANAGTGLGVVDHGGAVASKCTPKATYSGSEGAAPYFEPDVANQTALATTISGVVASTRSCVFDLAGKIKVDPDQAELGDVRINDMSVPFGGPDGFRMNSSSELELLGASCAQVRSTQVLRISADFPCQALLFI